MQTPAPTVTPEVKPQLPTTQPEEPKKEPAKKPKKPRLVEREGLIDFTFDNTPLVDVIKLYAKKKKLNIILPQQTAAIKQKITFNPERLLTLKEAEKYLYLFLDYAGYTVSPGPDFAIVIKGKEAAKNALPFYVFDSSGNLKLEDLPDNDSFIRAVYYFSNLKVSDAADTPVIKVLQDILSSPENVFADSQSNGIILTDKSRVIKSALQILRELDSIGSRYVLTTLQLYNAGAPSVADLLKTQILASQPRGFGEEKSAPGVGSYFSANMKVVADDRRNTLIIWGKEAAVNRLKDFVREYMDAPPESGKSVFHVYDLKYLDAESFATVLAQVVQSQGIGGEQTTTAQTAGARKLFEGVVVRAETYKPVESPVQTAGQPSDFEQSSSPVSSTGTVFRGGNRILVAAQPSDWDQIKRLIDQLDIPQRQVILEVMICDYTRSEVKSLGSQVRDLERMDFRPGVGFQTAHLNDTTPIIVNSDTNPTSITGDLLRLFSDSGGNATSIISSIDAGSFVISLNDPAGTGIWGVLSLLNSIGSARILTHPYLVALNNTNATINNTEIRRGTGDNSSSQGGAITVNIQDFTATVSLSLTPRISSSDRLNIEVIVQIQEFLSNAGFDRASRVMQTNVNMSSPDQVLVLGGLTRLLKTESTSETPILGRIPLFQWFFRRTELSTQETELAIFIRPTIIEPKLRDTMNAYTRSKIRTGARTADAYALGNEKDPIIRFFFGTTPPEEPIIEDYMRETNIVPAPEIIKPESPIVAEERNVVTNNLGVVRVS
jgi:type II secretory pathway component GspD/PulD (secretin)